MIELLRHHVERGHPEALTVRELDRVDVGGLRIGGDRCVALARSGPGHWLIESLGGRAGAVARIEELVKQPGGAPLELRWLADGTAVAGRFCGRCGTLFDDSPAFCRECGEPLSARP